MNKKRWIPLLALLSFALIGTVIGLGIPRGDAVSSRRTQTDQYDRLSGLAVNVQVLEGGEAAPLSSRELVSQSPALPLDQPTLAATVLTESGAPLVSATVIARPVKARAMSAWQVPPLSTVTDDNGRATLELPYWTQYAVSASKAGFAQQRHHVVPGSVIFVLEPAGSLDVFTFDADTKKPVDGVSLELRRDRDSYPTKCRTASDGRVRLDTLRPGTYSVGIAKDGYLDYELYDVAVSSEDEATCIIPLFQALSVNGVVVDQTTRLPIGPGSIEAFAGVSPVGHAPIDDNGHFSLRGLSTTSRLSLRVHVPGYDFARCAFDRSPRYDKQTGKQIGDAVVSVPQLASLAGTVRADGKPVADALVKLGLHGILEYIDRDTGSALDRVSTARTAEDGSFSISIPCAPKGVPNEGTWELLVLASGYAPHVTAVDSSWTPDLLIDLQRGHRIVLATRSATGAPDPFASIRTALRNPDREGDVAHVLDILRPPAVTDTLGFTSIEDLCAGVWEFHAISADGKRSAYQEIPIAGPGSSRLDLTLDDSLAAWGKVVDGAGVPIVGATVAWIEAPRRYYTASTADGEFALHLPVTGAVSLRLTGNFLPQVSTHDVFTGRPTTLEVSKRLHDDVIKGSAYDAETGLPLPLVSVRIEIDRGGGNHNLISRTVPGMSFQFSRGSGDGTATFEARGYDPCAFELSELSPVQPLRVLLQPKRHHDLPSMLRVHLPDGLVKPEVIAFDPRTGRERGRARYITPTEYELTIDRAGEVAVMVYTLKGFMQAPLRCWIGSDEDVDVKLSPGGGRIRGTTDHRSVSILDPHGLRTNLYVNDEGRFASYCLAPGTYTLEASGGPRLPVVVRNGEKTTVRL